MNKKKIRSWGSLAVGSYPIFLSAILGNFSILQKESWVFVADNTNICWVKIFHLYKGFHRKSTKEGYFIKGSARVVEPPRLEYKGFKYKYSVKGNIVRSLIVRTNRINRKHDGTNLKFFNNSIIIIKKKKIQNPSI